MNGDDSAPMSAGGQSRKLDPTAMVVVETDPPPSAVFSPTGLKTDGKSDGIIDLQIPNLLPTDNVVEEREVQVRRTKIPVRISHINVEVIDNGYIVHLPQAGRQHDYHGPDGARHAFDDKGEMLEFIGQVIGQVTYQYRESEMEEKLATMGEALEAGHDVALTGRGPIMVVQR